MELQKVKFDGSENGASVGHKINLAFRQVEKNARVFEFNEEEKVTIPDTNYTNIGTITKSVDDGIFIIGFNVAWNMSSTTKSPTIRLVVDNITQIEITKESKDKTDVIITSFNIPIVVTQAKTLEIKLEMKKETNAGVCEAIKSVLFIEKKF